MCTDKCCRKALPPLGLITFTWMILKLHVHACGSAAITAFIERMLLSADCGDASRGNQHDMQ